MNINVERAALKGQLQDCELELSNIETLAEGIVMQIRLKIHQNADSVTDLDTAEALVLMKDLHKKKERARILQHKIQGYQEQLYG